MSPTQTSPGQGEPSWYVPTDGDMQRFLGADGLPALHLIAYRDVAGEHTLRLCEDATGLLVGPTDRRLPAAGIYVSQLRGEAYHRDACRSGDFSPGAAVRLIREPGNEFDANAVAVYDATLAHLAAYMNKQKARILAKILDSGEKLPAISLRGTRPGKPCDQITVLATSRVVLDRLRKSRPSTLPTPAHLRHR